MKRGQYLRVIHVEDSPTDSELVQSMLMANGVACEFQRVETREQLQGALGEADCDLILSDCTLPQFHGLEALEMARAHRPDLPFIFVSGTLGEEAAIQSLQRGATDYVLKHRLSRLVPAVRRALMEAEGRAARSAMETQLHQARKLETIGTMVGGLAHDFRNLLQVLKTSIALLPLEATNPQGIIQLAGRLDKAVERGSHMMDELMVFARKTDIHRMPVDMAAQIREIMQMIEVGLPPNINLRLHLEENLPPVWVDPGQLDRILTNLVRNALDAMPEGGNLMISTDAIRFDRIPENSWQIKDVPYFRAMISDTGSGMNEATQSRVFEPFFTTKPAGKGTGLGLSVVFGLMEAHQGFIDLESKVGEGTTFSLFFPLPEDENPPHRIHVIFPTRLLGKVSPSEVTHARDVGAAEAK